MSDLASVEIVRAVGFPPPSYFPAECPFRTFKFGMGFPEGCPYRESSFENGYPEGCPVKYAMPLPPTVAVNYANPIHPSAVASGAAAAAFGASSAVSAATSVSSAPAVSSGPSVSAAPAVSAVSEAPSAAAAPAVPPAEPVEPRVEPAVQETMETRGEPGPGPSSTPSGDIGSHGDDMTAAGNGAAAPEPPPASFASPKPASAVGEKPRAADKPETGEFYTGKYIAGIIASLLLFGSAVAAMSVMWNSIPDFMKVLIIMFAGAGVTYHGFSRIRGGDTTVYSSVITGVGGGLMLIAIMTSYIVFQLIPLPVMLLFIAVWAAFFIGSYRYLRQFFLVGIAYYGSFSVLCLAFGEDSSMVDFGCISIFMLVLGFVMDFLSCKWMEDRQRRACAYMNLLTSMMLVAVAGVKYDDAYAWGQVLFILTLVASLVIALRLEPDARTACVALFFGLSTEAAAFSHIMDALDLNSGLAVLSFYLISCAILYFINGNESARGPLFVVLAVFTGFFASLHMLVGLHFICGLSLFLMFAMILFKTERKSSPYHLLTKKILFIDPAIIAAVFIFYPYSHSLWLSMLVIVVPSVVLAFRFFDDSVESRLSAMSTLMVAVACPVAAIFAGLPGDGLFSPLVFTFIGTMELVLFLAFRFGWFADWNGDRYFVLNALTSFGGPRRFDLICASCSKTFYSLALFCLVPAFLVCLLGPGNLPFSGFMAFSTVLLLVALGAYAIQYKPESFAMIALVALAFMWAFLLASCDQRLYSPIISFVGFFVGFLSVFGGFRFLSRRVRMFGLVLVILMTVKFITMDLFFFSGFQPIFLAGALALGGLCCLGITKLYSYFETMMSEEDKMK